MNDHAFAVDLQLEQNAAAMLSSVASSVGMACQSGVEDEAVAPPCCIAYVSDSVEAFLGTQVFRCRLHVQVQSLPQDGAAKHRQRVSAIDQQLLYADSGTGRYDQLAAALSSESLHVIAVLPRDTDSKVTDDLWVYERALDVVCQYHDESYSSSSVSSHSSPSTPSSLSSSSS